MKFWGETAKKDDDSNVQKDTTLENDGLPKEIVKKNTSLMGTALKDVPEGALLKDISQGTYTNGWFTEKYSAEGSH